MKTHGCIMKLLLPVMILGTTMVLFISLPISPTDERTLGESIFGVTENRQEKNAE
jgi:hypothetical protein